MKMILKLFSIGAIATTFSCASILSKSEYPITVSSNPEHVKFDIERIPDGMKIFKGETPTTVVLNASKGYFQKAQYRVNFYDNKGVLIKSVPLEANLDPWYVGNIVFGGLIGLLVVDPLTGAMWKLPEEVRTDLPEDKVGSIYIGKKRLDIVSYNEIPDSLKKKLVPVK